MTITDVLLALGILAAVLLSDLGTRRLGLQRIARPIIATTVTVVLYLHTVPTAGHDLYLELAGAAVGIGFGLLSILTIGVSHDPATGEIRTHAGWAYALLWIASVGGRLAFAYGAQHVFPGAMHTFMVSQDITSPNAIAAAFILMILAEVTTRTASLVIRGMHSAPAGIPAAA